jgi:hypothetical protein
MLRASVLKPFAGILNDQVWGIHSCGVWSCGVLQCVGGLRRVGPSKDEVLCVAA